MTPLQIAIAGFAAFVAAGLIAKVAIGRWIMKSGARPKHDSESDSR